MMFVRKPISPQTVVGKCRVDSRTKRLVKRLLPGEIAIIDHADIDRVAAEALIEARPAAVVNASSSITGRYPSVGARTLLKAGICLIDGAGTDVMTINEGAFVQLEGAQVFADGKLIAIGTRQTEASITDAIEAAKEGLSAELLAFAQNTLQYISEESQLLFDPPNPPQLRVSFKDRQVIVVVRGHDYKDDLRHLRSYVRDMRPVIMAVDGGADICLEHGLIPDVIIGDFDSVTDRALNCGAELVVHAYVGGDAPGAKRLDALGLKYLKYEAPGMSEDVAMLLAYEEGAELIVAVGTHASMVEFLDKGRAGMASTFLTRLKVGPRLVDAKGVSRLYQGTVRTSDFTFLIASALIAFVVMALVLEPFRTFLSGTWFLVAEFFGSLFRTIFH
jgi:uncharacterized membrane-anchored protein